MKKFLINTTPWETRIAITERNQLENIYFDAIPNNRLERSFFRGTVTKVLPGIQTAFVEIGQEKAGFLHISEIDRELAITRMSDLTDDQDDGFEADECAVPAQPAPTRHEKPDMNKILKEGEAILVEVSKEPIGEKGAKLTTCFTLPGRFVVLMPNIPRICISKKIGQAEERNRLREIIQKSLPEGMGAIIRTTAEDALEKEVVRDLNSLVKIWETIQKRFNATTKTEKLHEDLDLVLQIIRDNLDDNVESIVCDSKEVEAAISRFIKEHAPEHLHKIKKYEDPMPIFERFQVETQIEQALHSKVHLKSGGSIVIESTEAMTVIDVNTSRFTGTSSSLEETIFKTNQEAAEEIVRQLRLRNVGGLIVIDFIDMSSHSNRQKLFRQFEKMLKEKDKFQSVVLRVSEFGLVQMTRKRSGKTLQQQLTSKCSCCSGTGFTKSLQSEAFAVLHRIHEMLAQGKILGNITVAVHKETFNFLINTQYNAILTLEREFQCKITLAVADTDRLNVYNIYPSRGSSEKGA